MMMQFAIELCYHLDHPSVTEVDWSHAVRLAWVRSGNTDRAMPKIRHRASARHVAHSVTSQWRSGEVLLWANEARKVLSRLRSAPRPQLRLLGCSDSTRREMRRFARCYIAVCECLREEEDLRRLVREVAEDSAKSGATVALAERPESCMVVWRFGHVWNARCLLG